MDIYLEVGQKRVFACAIEWPGWSRSGRDEASALEAWMDVAPRYAKAIEAAGFVLDLPANKSLTIVERLPGGSATDFGAPATVPAADRRPCTADDLACLQSLLDAAWRAFDQAVAAAEGIALRKGPRGGGRDVAGIVGHVLDAHAAYLKALGGAPPKDTVGWPAEAVAALREASARALVARARGELPDHGPRGGERWTSRTFVRRAVWHILDHAWEIEDRLIA